MRVVRIAAIVTVILVIFFFLGRELWKNWQHIPFEQIRFNYWLVILSYVCMFAYFCASAFAWKRLLVAYDSKLSSFRSFQIVGISQLGKYIPGKVWFLLGRMYLAKQFNIPERISFVSLVLETMLILITGGVIAVLTVAAQWIQNLSIRALVAFAAIIGTLVFVHPRIFGRLVDFMMRVLKQEIVRMNVTFGGIVVLLMLYFVCWFWAGTAFFIIVRSFYEVEIGKWLLFVGVFALAWVTGFVSFLTPAGLGVREGVMAFLLSFYMPVSMAVIVALVARVWVSMAEVMFFLVALPGIKKWNIARLEANAN